MKKAPVNDGCFFIFWPERLHTNAVILTALLTDRRAEDVSPPSFSSKFARGTHVPRSPRLFFVLFFFLFFFLFFLFLFQFNFFLFDRDFGG